MAKTTNDFKIEVKNLVENEYTVLGEYTGTNNKILMYHNTCNREYEVTPNKFKQGRRCPYCNPKKVKKTTEQFKHEVDTKRNNEYTVLGEYKTKKDKILVRHNLCGHEFYAIAGNLVRTNKPTGCPECFSTKKYDNETFQQMLDNKTNGMYTLIGNYVNNKTDVTLLHKRCNKEIIRKPTHIQQRDICCEHCQISKGEEKIKNYLIQNNIHFKQQFQFENLKNIRNLKFDFIIYINNNFLLLEYDGEFHFDKVKFINENHPDKFINQRKNDEIKNNFCVENNFKLLRIPFWEYNNVETILEKVINEIKGSTTILKESTIEAYWKQETSYLLL